MNKYFDLGKKLNTELLAKVLFQDYKLRLPKGIQSGIGVKFSQNIFHIRFFFGYKAKIHGNYRDTFFFYQDCGYISFSSVVWI